jgi:hypothetical protein
MPTVTIEYTTEAERLALEQAIAYFAQLRQVAASAPDGTVLDACERVALGSGRALLRDTLASAIPSRVEAAEQKGGRRVAALARNPDGTRGGTAEPC